MNKGREQTESNQRTVMNTITLCKLSRLLTIQDRHIFFLLPRIPTQSLYREVPTLSLSLKTLFVTL